MGNQKTHHDFQMNQPVASHFRMATCEEVDCPHFLLGWKTIVPAGGDLEDWARHTGRRFTETHMPGQQIEFVFHAGQECFRSSTHVHPIGRPPFLYHDKYHIAEPARFQDDMNVAAYQANKQHKAG
jgi:hypothetical protein